MVCGGGFARAQQVSHVCFCCRAGIHELNSGHTRTKPDKASDFKLSRCPPLEKQSTLVFVRPCPVSSATHSRKTFMVRGGGFA